MTGLSGDVQRENRHLPWCNGYSCMCGVTTLRCGAIAGRTDVTPCPDPYCRVCRDHTGEVIDPPQFGRQLQDGADQ